MSLISKVVVALIMLVGVQVQAEDICKKEQAQEAVEKMCAEIEKNDSAKAIEALKKFRYCGSNYVWVQDSDIKMVVHPTRPKLDGSDLKLEMDNNGNGSKALFVEFDKMARKNKNGGWVDYLWPKPGAENATPKTSFVKLCKGDKKWIAGSGIWK
ncbi:MAG: chemotaxis protein [Bdellovibrionales bacterium RIFCSPHIGHO2_01_FULL_40_29]|nr:MAG: chemotaxis protein [Bdellovibrionales bacterium RIFCSPHIGHO2_01_FULL_40_29]OFZ34964.1 MAG: chemotaxis protein [Bdellovibrionales bacterium RIFCSPHIGHO2_02_FULL_40_15]